MEGDASLLMTMAVIFVLAWLLIWLFMIVFNVEACGGLLEINCTEGPSRAMRIPVLRVVK